MGACVWMGGGCRAVMLTSSCVLVVASRLVSCKGGLVCGQHECVNNVNCCALDI